jgi:S1-C subfamily serine protease
LQVGDVLVKYNDEEAEPGLEELVAELGPGATVKLTIERNDKQQVLTLTVGAP